MNASKIHTHTESFAEHLSFREVSGQTSVLRAAPASLESSPPPPPPPPCYAQDRTLMWLGLGTALSHLSPSHAVSSKTTSAWKPVLRDGSYQPLTWPSQICLGVEGWSNLLCYAESRKTFHSQPPSKSHKTPIGVCKQGKGACGQRNTGTARDASTLEGKLDAGLKVLGWVPER